MRREESGEESGGGEGRIREGSMVTPLELTLCCELSTYPHFPAHKGDCIEVRLSLTLLYSWSSVI